MSARSAMSLDFAAGSLTAVIGPNGAGKTSFFNLISGAFRPDHGRILLDGEDIAGLPASAVVRRGIGRAFQIASIFSALTVREAILGAVNAHRRWYARLGRFPPQAQAQADEVMELVGLTATADRVSGNLVARRSENPRHRARTRTRSAGPAARRADRGDGAGRALADDGDRPPVVERKKMTLIFIEHDMDIVFNFAQTIRVLSYGACWPKGRPKRSAAIQRSSRLISVKYDAEHA